MLLSSGCDRRGARAQHEHGLPRKRALPHSNRNEEDRNEEDKKHIPNDKNPIKAGIT